MDVAFLHQNGISHVICISVVLWYNGTWHVRATIPDFYYLDTTAGYNKVIQWATGENISNATVFTLNKLKRVQQKYWLHSVAAHK